MGQRQSTETPAKIYAAFLSRRTWSQAELARHVGVGVPALKKALHNMREGGSVPLTDEADPPHVYWSVPRTWFPGGVLFETHDIEVLLRQLMRLPKSKDRERLLKIALSSLPKDADPASAAVIPREASQAEEQHLAAIEDATAKKRPLRFRYYTASRGTDALRSASVHRVFVGPPTRFLATCHRDGTLKWFRVDNVSDARIDTTGEFRPASKAEIERTLRGSLNGYQGEGKLERHTFFVTEPDARSVVKNLLEGMEVEDTKGGIRVSVETTALPRLARYVVGLGSAARAETEALRAAVRELARGALEANR